MIAITGATGRLGHLVVEGVLDKHGSDGLVAVVRDPAKAADLAERGVAVRAATYGDPGALEAALAGVETLLLVSGSELGQRVEQHTNVVNAARAAGVRRVVYTSAPHADTTELVLAPEHKATEQVLRESGLTYTFLRNGWYNENFTDTIRLAAETGSFGSSAGEGRTASAAIADFAAAAVEVLTTDGHDNRVYELTGDVAWTHAELAKDISAVTGKTVEFRALTPEEYRDELVGAGVPAPTADFVVALAVNTADGVLGEVNGELAKLIGRPTTPISVTIGDLVGS